MKKTVKSLIIASSVAAIAGIGAVSFAKWQGETVVANRDAAVSTGNITIDCGFVTSGAVTLSGSLVPVDQGSGTTILSGELGNIQVKKGKYNFKLEKSTSETSDIKLYYQVSGSTVAAPASLTAETGADVAAKETSIENQLTGWTQLGSATTQVSLTDKEVEVLTGYKLYVVMVSSDANDMNKTINLKLSVEYAA